jgi:hypothetical protein
MTKTLYEEAVADANRLRQLAEDTAKNKIVEAVMPQIRSMVNQRIMGESIDVDHLDMSSFDEPEELSFEEPDEDTEEVETSDVQKTSGPVINIDVAGDANFDYSTSEEENILTDQMSEALLKLISSNDNSGKVTKKIVQIENRFNKLKSLIENIDFNSLGKNQLTRINKAYRMCVKEAVIFSRSAILIEQATQEEDLERRLTIIIKEMRNMSKSNSRNIFDFLFEGEDVKETELEEAELSLELSDDERDELAGAEDAAAVDDALDAILGDLEVSMEAEEASEEAEAEDGEELDAEDADADAAGDAELEAEVTEEMDEVYEIDEATLRRELFRLQEDAVDAVDQFGGGEAPHGDVFVDVDEDDLINALADELGAAPEQAPAVAAESRTRRNAGRQLREARRTIRKYEGAVSELKKQLLEMNLFNAKLLYANKLMQNKNLSLKQQKAIVEALDNAKTLREAKLLFRSLSESLVRKRTGKKLTEGSLRTIGSSSRSTRSARPNTNGNEADRWAVLAGLNS